MDLVGLAAILAIPAGLIVAIAGVAGERSLFKRWQRVETMLKEGTLQGAERAMIENARNHLAERIAVAELAPRHTVLLLTAVASGLLGFYILDGVFVFPEWEEAPGRETWVVLGWILYFVGLFGFYGRIMSRMSWVKKNQPSNFLRSNTIL